jgi:hypothetical protein
MINVMSEFISKKLLLIYAEQQRFFKEAERVRAIHMCTFTRIKKKTLTAA